MLAAAVQFDPDPTAMVAALAVSAGLTATCTAAQAVAADPTAAEGVLVAHGEMFAADSDSTLAAPVTVVVAGDDAVLAIVVVAHLPHGGPMAWWDPLRQVSPPVHRL
jgi:hypothetical protein